MLSRFVIALENKDLRYITTFKQKVKISNYVHTEHMINLKLPYGYQLVQCDFLNKFLGKILYSWASLVAQTVNSLAMQKTYIQSLSCEDPLEEGMATHSSILAWSIPWTEEPGRPRSTGSQRIRHTQESKHFLQSIGQSIVKNNAVLTKRKRNVFFSYFAFSFQVIYTKLWMLGKHCDNRFTVYISVNFSLQLKLTQLCLSL